MNPSFLLDSSSFPNGISWVFDPLPSPAPSQQDLLCDKRSSRQISNRILSDVSDSSNENCMNIGTSSSPLVRLSPTSLSFEDNDLIRQPISEDSSLDHYLSTPSNDFSRPSPVQDRDVDVVISISTAFHPDRDPSPDLVLTSSDGVLFYVNSQTILTHCRSAFQSNLCTPNSASESRNSNVQVNAPGPELNVMLHALYGTSPAAYSPDFETIVRAIDLMPTYYIPPEALVKPSTPLHDLVLSHAPLHPLETYALAAHHNLHAMAVSASSHLLSYDLGSISDAMAERIGAIYLKKLLLLRVGRFTSLKTILLHPPHPHPPTKQCGFVNQKNLTRSWALVSAYLAWDSGMDLSTNTMRAALDPLMEHVQCVLCHQGLQDRIKDVVVQWASVKVSGL